MNPHDVVQSALNRVREVVDSIRRQAPGARMVGEFAVRMATRDVARRLSGGTHGHVTGVRPQDVEPIDAEGADRPNGD